MITKCAFCGKEIDRIPSRALKKHCFCCTSHQMKYEYKMGSRIGSDITKKAHQILREKGHYKRDNSYLSNPNRISEEAKKKLSEDRKGEGNPMYGAKPWNKLTPTKKWWEEKEFVNLRKVCLKRDNFKCVDCGVSQKEKDLYCDHVIPYRVCQEHKLNNLQSLCGSCHSKKTVRDFHKYKEFYKNKLPNT